MSIIDDIRIEQNFDPEGENGGYKCDLNAGPDEKKTVVSFRIKDWGDFKQKRVTATFPSSDDICGAYPDPAMGVKNPCGEIILNEGVEGDGANESQMTASPTYLRPGTRKFTDDEREMFGILKDKIAIAVRNKHVSAEACTTFLKQLAAKRLVHLNLTGMKYMANWIDSLTRDRQVGKYAQLGVGYGSATGRWPSGHQTVKFKPAPKAPDPLSDVDEDGVSGLEKMSGKTSVSKIRDGLEDTYTRGSIRSAIQSCAGIIFREWEKDPTKSRPVEHDMIGEDGRRYHIELRIVRADR